MSYPPHETLCPLGSETLAEVNEAWYTLPRIRSCRPAQSLILTEGSHPVASYASTPADTPGSTADLQGNSAIARWRRVSSLAGQISRSAVDELLDRLGDDDPLVSWQAGIALGQTAARLRSRARWGCPAGTGRAAS